MTRNSIYSEIARRLAGTVGRSRTRPTACSRTAPSRAQSSGTLLVLLGVMSLVGGCAKEIAVDFYSLPSKDLLVDPNAPFEELAVNLAGCRSVQGRESGQDKELAVAVAISGGGNRASNFGVGVLLGLEAIERGGQEGLSGGNVLREVDYLSTASGGGLAAAAYISSLYDYLYFRTQDGDGGVEPNDLRLMYDGYSFAAAVGCTGEECGCGLSGPPAAGEFTDPCLRRHLTNGYADDIFKYLFRQIWLGIWDWGDSLEPSFDDTILGYLLRERKLAAVGQGNNSEKASLVVGDIFSGCEGQQSGNTSDVRLPYWVMNATARRTGAIFTFTPDQLKLYKVNRCRHRMEDRSFDDGNYDKFPLSVGLKASSSYPVAIPATTLGVRSESDESGRYLHLIDGGVADNLGVVTALRLLQQDTAKRKALIVVDAFNESITPFSSESGESILRAIKRAGLAGLDSWRGRYREVVKALCKSPNLKREDTDADIEVIFLSFDDLACREGPTRLEDLFAFELTECDLQSLKMDREVLAFRAVRSISTVEKTTVPLSGAEQNILFAAGRYIVEQKREKIIEALGWAEL